MSARLRTSQLRDVVTAVAAALLLVAAIGSLTQAAPQATPAAQLVSDALAKEAQGTASGRAVDLKAALEKSPDYAPARWHLGFVKYNDQWRTYDDAARIAGSDPTRAAYRRLRDSAPTRWPVRSSWLAGVWRRSCFRRPGLITPAWWN